LSGVASDGALDAPAPSTRRRELATALGLGLLGGAVVSVTVSRPWAALTLRPAGLPATDVAVAGSEVVPLVSALGVVILAGTVATVATRGLARRLCGVLLGCAGAAVVVAVVRVDAALDAQLSDRVVGAVGAVASSAAEATATPWRWLCLLGGAAAALTGVLVVWRGQRWPAMGARYDAPSNRSRSADTDADLWRALDQGEDPTDNPSR
jgi:uncharacterized membrane protein (TIGR02234 family)